MWKYTFDWQENTGYSEVRSNQENLQRSGLENKSGKPQIETAIREIPRKINKSLKSK